ncbi:hypothetical protein NH340_JMT03332 [Sarcoptes scabiei]|nr:hypothetical protein NH340_JMT03332 [Sarcoptes scabiei]
MIDSTIDDDDDDTDGKLNEKQEKKEFKKIDENELDKLWDMFKNDNSKSSSGSSSKETSDKLEKIDNSLAASVQTKTIDVREKSDSINTNDGFISSSIPKSSASNSHSQKNITISPIESSSKPIKRANSNNLTNILDQFNKKKPKMNILTKSLHDWNDFKASNSIEEELDQHNRSRGSYLERQAFLMRTDLREFEQEKSMRDRIRKLRDLNNL